MDYSLLVKVGTVIDIFIKGGYALSAGVLVKTGYIYYKDYKHSVEQDRVEADKNAVNATEI